MKNKWTTTKLVAIGSVSVLSILFALSGATISAITGITGASGILNSIWGAVFNSFIVFLIPQFGTATIFNLIYSILALPLPLEGTPGFLPKILIGLSVGLIVDIVFHFFKKKPYLTAILIGSFSQYLIGFEIYALGSIFKLPKIDVFQKLIFSPVMIILTIIFMGFFGYIGYVVYQKIKNTSIVKRIQH